MVQSQSIMKTVLKLALITLMPFAVGLAVNSGKPASAIDSDSGLYVYPEHLDGPYTGGFGEETCRSCHFDYDLNMDGGSLTIAGLDDSYTPGEVIPITVTVQSEELEIGGFQLSARFEDGTQAGSFQWDGNELMFTPEVNGDVQYIQHSEEGTKPTDGSEVSWSINWITPESGEAVIINVAANAGNYDDSSFGDWIYAKEITLKPAGI